MTKGKGVGGGECQKKQPKTGKILSCSSLYEAGTGSRRGQGMAGFSYELFSTTVFFLSICECYFDEKLKFRSVMVSLKEKH